MRRIAAALGALMLFAQSAYALEGTEWIGISDVFVEPEMGGEYAAQLVMGDTLIDLPALAEELLGPGYTDEGGGRLCEAKDGELWEIKRMGIDGETGTVSYWDPFISSERGAEYEAPAIGIAREEALLLCRSLMKDILPEAYFERLSGGYAESDRWSAEENRLMDEAEYDALFRERKLAYFHFDHAAENGLSILGEGLMTSVGANGLNGFTLNWHAFAASEEKAELMPLQEAVEMASSTRSAEALLLYAEPVYSNWVSGDGTYNLSWYLVTGSGRYVVDCVLGRHVCDSWEY